MLLDQVYRGKLKGRFPLYAAGGDNWEVRKGTFSIFSLHSVVKKSVTLIVYVFNDLFLQLGIQMYSHLLFFRFLFQASINSSSWILCFYITNCPRTPVKGDQLYLNILEETGNWKEESVHQFYCAVVAVGDRSTDWFNHPFINVIGLLQQIFIEYLHLKSGNTMVNR